MEVNWGLFPEDPNGSAAGITGNEVDPVELNGLVTAELKGFAAAVVMGELPKILTGAVDVDVAGAADDMEAIPLLAPNTNDPPPPKANEGGGSELDEDP